MFVYVEKESKKEGAPGADARALPCSVAITLNTEKRYFCKVSFRQTLIYKGRFHQNLIFERAVVKKPLCSKAIVGQTLVFIMFRHGNV